MEKLARDASREMNLRTSAVNHICNLRFEASRAALVSLMEDPEPQVASTAAVALGRLRDERALPRLLADGRGSDKESRRSVLGVLANFPGSDAAEELLRIDAADPDEEISKAAASSLEEIKRQRARGKPK